MGRPLASSYSPRDDRMAIHRGPFGPLEMGQMEHSEKAKGMFINEIDRPAEVTIELLLRRCR